MYGLKVHSGRARGFLVLESMGAALARKSGALFIMRFARATKRASSRPPIMTVAANGAPARRHLWHSLHRRSRIVFIIGSAVKAAKLGGESGADGVERGGMRATPRSEASAALAFLSAARYVAFADARAVASSTVLSSKSTDSSASSPIAVASNGRCDLNHE